MLSIRRPVLLGTLVAGLTAATLTLAACSSSEGGTGSPAGSGGSTSSSTSWSSSAAKPADAKSLVSDALDAFEQAPAAHVSGSGTSDNETIAIDIKYGDDVAIGDLTLQGKQIELSKVADGTTYFKAATDFWTTAGVPADAAASLNNKYVEITSSTAGFSDIAKLLDRSQFVDAFRPDDSDLGGEVSGPTQVDGISCYGVEDTDGKGAFYAAASTPPYPVQLKSEEGTFDFDGYTDTVDVPTPAPADVVQLPGS